MYKISHVNENKEDRENHEKIYGNFNDFPPGWKEITAAEFAKSQLGSNVPQAIEYRQMMRPENLQLRSKHGQLQHVSAQLCHVGAGKGYAIVPRYWEEDVRFFVFDAAEKYKDFFNSLPILNAGEWTLTAGSNPSRGYRNYDRYIQFSRELTTHELGMVVEHLKADNCPGWTGITTGRTAPGIYRFNTTWDSSD